MASPIPKRNFRPARSAQRLSSDAQEVVDPRWLLKAAGITVAAAVVCAYLAVCLLIYQGGWQYVLHPVKKIDRTPASASLPFSDIAFDAATTGTPRLTAWWIPSASNSESTPTILFLHDGHGSLSDTVPALSLLHAASVNLFAIDYRGFGRSEAVHPSEARMTEDTAAALDYLVNTRHIAAKEIVPYGAGLGAALAASLAQTHPDLPAVILDNPDLEAATRPAQEKRGSLLPMRLLLRDHFNLQAAVKTLQTPKLLIAGRSDAIQPQADALREQFFATLPDPKIIVRITQSNSDSAYQGAVKRFLDAYLSRPFTNQSP